MHSPYGFTLWDPTGLQCLLQHGVKSGRILADGRKIILLAYFPSPELHVFFVYFFSYEL
jgi:hypothetical protein